VRVPPQVEEKERVGGRGDDLCPPGGNGEGRTETRLRERRRAGLVLLMGCCGQEPGLRQQALLPRLAERLLQAT